MDGSKAKDTHESVMFRGRNQVCVVFSFFFFCSLYYLLVFLPLPIVAVRVSCELLKRTKQKKKKKTQRHLAKENKMVSISDLQTCSGVVAPMHLEQISFHYGKVLSFLLS